MEYGFWGKIEKPVIALAPMADVTDFAFREIITECGKPAVLWTEFVSADGLASPKGREKLLIDLKFSKKEKPIVAQIFTANPENARKAAELCVSLGFDGIDINMGCPDRKVEKQGAGAALIREPEKAKAVLLAAKQGAGKIPVSVKTRIGYLKPELDTWLPHLLEREPAMITVHARTRKEMSKVPARWEFVADAVNIRDKYFPHGGPLIFGNGDVLFPEDGKKKCEETGADGAMLGRAIFGNPWLFSESVPSRKDKFRVMLRHTELFEKEFSGIKSFAVMKKHFKAYVSGFSGASALRAKLMETGSAAEVKKILTDGGFL